MRRPDSSPNVLATWSRRDSNGATCGAFGGSGAVWCREWSSAGEDDLAGGLAFQHRAHALLGALQRQLRADLGAYVVERAEAQQVGELVAGAHGGADNAQLEEEQPLQFGVRVGAAGRARDHDDSARL